MTPEKQIEKVEKLFEMISEEYVKPEEVEEIFAAILALIEKNKAELEQKMAQNKGEMAETHREMYSEMEAMESRMKEMHSKMETKMTVDKKEMMVYCDTEMHKLEDMMPEMPDLMPLEQRITEVEAKIPQLPEIPDIIPLEEKLEEIKQDIEKLKKDVKTASGRPIFGAASRYKQISAGTNVTVTENKLGYITIAASGGGTNILEATGDVDDANTTFTFVSEPTMVVVNGSNYRNGHGCTIAGTTVTLDNPVGTDGDIYGL